MTSGNPEQQLQSALHVLAGDFAPMTASEADLRRTLVEYTLAAQWYEDAERQRLTRRSGALLCASAALLFVLASWFWLALSVGVLAIVCVGGWLTAQEEAVQWRTVAEQRRRTLLTVLHQPATRETVRRILHEVTNVTNAHRIDALLAEARKEASAAAGGYESKVPHE
jgi:hypothetical protein